MGAQRERLSAGDRVIAWVAPALLIVVAGIAAVRHHTVDQSPWQGVGFGMFSSYDYLLSRTARITSIVDGRATEVTVPVDLRDDLERVLVAPGDPEATELAVKLRSRAKVDQLRLEILGHDVEETNDGLRITLVPIRTVEVG